MYRESVEDDPCKNVMVIVTRCLVPFLKNIYSILTSSETHGMLAAPGAHRLHSC